jgi:PIN domain nuclease of toxin-antitoxin system
MLGNRKRISPSLRRRIEAGAFISTASLWEIAIKSSIGKLEAPKDLPRRVETMGFELLQVTAEHAWHVRSLPDHHGDPFDRLLIAQAQLEAMPVVTADPAFGYYDVAIVWD